MKEKILDFFIPNRIYKRERLKLLNSFADTRELFKQTILPNRKKPIIISRSILNNIDPDQLLVFKSNWKDLYQITFIHNGEAVVTYISKQELDEINHSLG